MVEATAPAEATQILFQLFSLLITWSVGWLLLYVGSEWIGFIFDFVSVCVKRFVIVTAREFLTSPSLKLQHGLQFRLEGKDTGYDVISAGMTSTDGGCLCSYFGF